MVTTAVPASADQPPVRIITVPGVIRIVAPTVLSGSDQSVVHRLVERLLEVGAVETLDIDYVAGEVTVTYDGKRLGHAAALSSISAALRGDDSPRPDKRNVDFDFDRIVGRVIRVERRRHQGGVMTTIISAGADFLAAIAPRIGRGNRRHARRNGHGTDKLLVRDGLAIRYVPLPPGEAVPDAMLLSDDVAQSALASSSGSDPVARQTIVVARGWRRAANLAAAGGCFFMSFVGLITPGIPTVPFVLATSYFLVRSSPALDERLRRSRLFGQMVRDWTTYGGMRPSTKLRIVLLTLAIMGGTLFIVEPTGPILIVMGVMGTLGVTLILSTPTVPQDAADDTSVLIPG